MRPIFHLLLSIVLLASLAACEKQPAPTETSAFALKTATLTVAGQTITAEIADTRDAMQTGLMYRRTMPEDHGMIFVFPEERQASFWMHNTNLPLDIAYLDRQGQIREIHAAAPRDDTPIPSATSNIAYALEMNQGWFGRKGIVIGTQISGLPSFPAKFR